MNKYVKYFNVWMESETSEYLFSENRVFSQIIALLLLYSISPYDTLLHVSSSTVYVQM